jgi:hypothetical protein
MDPENIMKAAIIGVVIFMAVYMLLDLTVSDDFFTDKRKRHQKKIR